MPHLITGGARSGKSRYAEQLALAHPGPVVYLATARRTDDAEFTARIAEHQARRPASWHTVEPGETLAQALCRAAAPQRLLLVDCLTLWLARFCEQETPDAGRYAGERAALLAALPTLPGSTLLVSNEIGWGVVPLGAATRWFVDELGRLNQAVAACCKQVTLVACGLPLPLKPARQPAGG
ncbi:bifunctional adenosylcobinamide kinase/adenosylcobinamide-phosphate guanylyltransferase [Chitiniphilus purpureus]|uniref:Bifunctional adenosylcobalamin biosynthesis protein n=1 Tax=Chitiniphilus purpureus TaxID=2981137 RepID=A0ABY6DNL7_9NEIS|nr:bifunctional adenosylcobinamide kinase/adenosylcobinamide-phosphate guanylyltransferase [Chitiniphilus sp. CD1]UXY15970.1 bifunctional adenosylcobinamide kinase/adenosylcobinamide-phosphate guanylyltransferase [Chitiniphilus sp. CD1]